MRLCISNIAWDAAWDEEMYAFLSQQGFAGLEIAPTRLFAMPVYERCGEAAEFAQRVKRQYRLTVCSMQSILFGRAENFFVDEEQRNALLEYTKEAIVFAEACGCGNLVFGCPRNRNIQEASQYPVAVAFFRELGNFAFQHHTVLAIEANPTIYNTNFINTTADAFQLAEDVGSKGLMVNLDLGTVIYNRETLQGISGKLDYINHVHISEPNLAAIEPSGLHKELAKLLRAGGYGKYVSIEMKNSNNIELVKQTANYVGSVFSN